jgi:hypothetical protein
LTKTEIETKLKETAKESLNVMNISHGHNERVIAYDGNEFFISDIVDVFSEENCPALKTKSKLFFFNCCRNSSIKIQ